MRSFLAGIGGQYVLRGNRREDSYWRRVLKSATQEARAEGWDEGWEGGMEKGKEEGKEEEAIDSLTEYLEFKFNKRKAEILPLIDETSLEEIRALKRFAYTCDNFDVFIQQAEEAKRRSRSS